MRLREIARPGAPGAVGAWCRIPSPLTVELMARSGFDWACIDLQHGAGGEHDLSSLLLAIDACGLPSLVRVGWNDPTRIMRALDAGAEGVIVPMVNNAEHARRAADAAHYAPVGYRSWGPLRSNRHGAALTAQSVNEAVLCLAMIETSEAVRNIDEILAVEGIDGAYIGPTDLAVSEGFGPRDVRSVEPLIAGVRRTCEEAGVVVGIHTSGADAARTRLAEGYQLIAVANDASMLGAAAAGAAAAVRAGNGVGRL